MICIQTEFHISPKPRGFHLITSEVVNAIPEIRDMKHGMLNLFIKHTSASITLNEGVAKEVQVDLEAHFNRLAADDTTLYSHRDEGPDDMPAHVKNSLIGSSLGIPITHGKLNLGTWQGIFLCEHRNHGGTRKLVATLFGV